MADMTIKDYQDNTSIDSSNDYFLGEQNSTGDYRRYTRNSIMGVTGQPADISSVQTFTNKTLTSPVITTPTMTTPTVTSGMNITNGTLSVTNNATVGGTLVVTGVLTPTGGLSANSVNAAALDTTALGRIYPVGCIYTETTGANPATIFGFGTWIAFGAGRVLIGNGTSDAAYTAGATGGESTHALSTVELAAHKHKIGMRGDGSTVGGNIQFSTSGNTNAFDSAGTAGNTTSGGADGLSYSAGSGTAHNNLQPYIVVYFWHRTV